MTFALAWLRVTDLMASLKVVLGTFVSYGIAFVLMSLVVGWPIAVAVVRFGLLRWWTSVAIPALFGLLLGWMFRSGGSGDNPFAASFSPWSRDKPGFVGDIPFTHADAIGSAVLGAIVGASFGLAFWLSFTRDVRSNISLQADRER
jgi:hypothetical protein